MSLTMLMSPDDTVTPLNGWPLLSVTVPHTGKDSIEPLISPRSLSGITVPSSIVISLTPQPAAVRASMAEARIVLYILLIFIMFRI